MDHKSNVEREFMCRNRWAQNVLSNAIVSRDMVGEVVLTLNYNRPGMGIGIANL